MIQLKNASRAKKTTIEYPYSNTVFSIAKILEKEGRVQKTSTISSKGKKFVKVDLKYNKHTPLISDINLISKPSMHYHIKKNRATKLIPRNAIGIISTNKGIMTTRQAQKQGLGGELICQIS